MVVANAGGVISSKCVDDKGWAMNSGVRGWVGGVSKESWAEAVRFVWRR